jgi:hypothetical protein
MEILNVAFGLLCFSGIPGGEEKMVPFPVKKQSIFVLCNEVILYFSYHYDELWRKKEKKKA